MDKFESKLNKKDEAIAMQNKVAAEDAVKRIVEIYGPIEDDEVKFYRKRLLVDGFPLINSLQFQLIGYQFYKYFECPQTFISIRNTTDYIKLIICSKRILKQAGMVLLPYIMSSKVVRVAARKIISKKDATRFERTQLYEDLKFKYNNDEHVLQKVWELISSVISSSFEIIDYDPVTKKGTQYDGQLVPMINDLISEEMLFFITSI